VLALRVHDLVASGGTRWPFSRRSGRRRHGASEHHDGAYERRVGRNRRLAASPSLRTRWSDRRAPRLLHPRQMCQLLQKRRTCFPLKPKPDELEDDESGQSRCRRNQEVALENDCACQARLACSTWASHRSGESEPSIDLGDAPMLGARPGLSCSGVGASFSSYAGRDSVVARSVVVAGMHPGRAGGPLMTSESRVSTAEIARASAIASNGNSVARSG
jgi:hypothetical protein